MKKKFRNYESYALVTGAASGMGRLYVRRLAMRGYNVIMVDINAVGLRIVFCVYDFHDCDPFVFIRR